MKRSSASRVALAASLLSFACSVHALSVATSTLSDFRIVLTDLAPSDGVSPRLTLDPMSRSQAQAGAVAPGANTFWVANGTGAFAPVAASGQLDGIGGSASLSGDPLGTGALATASAMGRPGFVGGTGSVYVDSQPSGTPTFTLSAHTQVSFSGLAHVDWSAGDPLASADGQFGLSFYEIQDSGLVNVAQDAWAVGYFGASGTALAGSESSPLSITFANNSDDVVVLGYFLNVFAGASEVDVPSSPVAEPQNAMLLMAGFLPSMLILLRGRAARRGSRR